MPIISQELYLQTFITSVATIYIDGGTKKIHTGCPLLGPWYINRKRSYNLMDETKWMEVVNWHMPRTEKKSHELR